MQKRSWSLDRSKFYTYNIMLGSACNWNCPYCIQSDANIKQADPYQFYEQLFQHLENTKRFDQIFTFQLWGGEPLLYWKTLKVLVEKLSRLEIHSPIRIVSNGSLLDRDKIRFLNQYSESTRFEISYHEGQLPLSTWKEAMRIRSLMISSLLTHQIHDIEYYRKIWDRLSKTFGRRVAWYVFPLIDAGKTTSQYALTPQDIERHFKQLGEYLSANPNDSFYMNMTQGLAYGMSSKGLYKYGNKCHNERVVSIDMYGRQYTCHHDYTSTTYIGNLFVKNIPIIPKQKKIPANCYTCKAYKLCTGGCFRNQHHEVECFYYQKLHQFLINVQKDFPHILDREILSFL